MKGHRTDSHTEEWTPARVWMMIDLKRRGRTASQIAKQLGGTTRNAVVGKLNRMGYGQSCDGFTGHGNTGMAQSTDKGVRTKAMYMDLSPEMLLRPRRFSWEDAEA